MHSQHPSAPDSLPLSPLSSTIAFQKKQILCINISFPLRGNLDTRRNLHLPGFQKMNVLIQLAK
ncbi:hypothetical protein Mapa_017070 [Marchantia paleacea]|nr:hypothetical protein Mapa_017070 [Marchantia paleacea]